MRTLFLTLVSMLAVAAVAEEPATLAGKVVSVHDGDTLRVLDAANVQHIIRLQAANYITATCPHYVAKSFKAVGR